MIARHDPRPRPPLPPTPRHLGNSTSMCRIVIFLFSILYLYVRVRVRVRFIAPTQRPDLRVISAALVPVLALARVLGLPAGLFYFALFPGMYDGLVLLPPLHALFQFQPCVRATWHPAPDILRRPVSVHSRSSPLPPFLLFFFFTMRPPPPLFCFFVISSSLGSATPPLFTLLSLSITRLSRPSH